MKRLVLCALALLLTTGALLVGGSQPAYACTIDPACASDGCDWCPNGGICNYCTGSCRCL